MSRRSRIWQVLSALIAAVLIGCALVWPRAVAAGWLTGFACWAAVPIGGLGFLMIHRLTGGQWGLVISPVLLGAARAVPLLWLGIIPVFIGIPVLFVWAGGGHARPEVLTYYLNWPLYIVRSVVVLAGFTAFSIAIVRGRGATLLAAAGITFFAVAITIIGLDWVLAVHPETLFTAFGAATAVEYLAATLAWTVLVLPDMPQQTRKDLAGIMIALVLASIYMNYMDFMILWYGDVPAKIAWFIPRSSMPWKPFLVAGLLFGGIGPLLALLFGRTSFSGDNLKPAAISMLFGFACYEIWQVLPPFGVAAIPFAVLSMLAIGALALGLVRGGYRVSAGGAHG